MYALAWSSRTAVPQSYKIIVTQNESGYPIIQKTLILTMFKCFTLIFRAYAFKLSVPLHASINIIYTNYMRYERNYKDATQQMVVQTTMSRVYGWMSLALIISAVSALYTVQSPTLLSLVFSSKFTFFGLIIAELALVMGLTANIRRLSFAVAALLMGLYSIINGVTLSSILLVYQAGTIQAAFLASALTFGSMSAIGYFTRKDLSSMGGLLTMGLIGVIIASLVNIFMHNSTLDAIITYIGLFVFIGLTAYDTQKIKMWLASQNEMQMDVRKIALLGALNLYLDFINIFLFILRLLGRRD